MPAEERGAEPPHPREVHALVGHRAVAEQLLAAERSGRLHHAWLLAGPPGIGKATLAYRFARFLLAPAAERIPGGDGLAVDRDGRTARQVAAGSHPNLSVLERAPGPDGKVPRTLSVEAVRRGLSFFGTTAADGGRRICIIDAADDLTVAAANALLKAVEEPPPGALVLILSHGLQPLLPTVRSRCRLLPFGALTESAVGTVLGELGTGADPALLAAAAARADGSVARALTLLDPKLIAVLDEVRGLLAGLPRLPTAAVIALADRLADRRSDTAFPHVLATVLRWLGEEVSAGAGRPLRRLAPLVEVCEKIEQDARDLETYNLDRRLFVLSMFGDLAEAVARAA